MNTSMARIYGVPIFIEEPGRGRRCAICAAVLVMNSPDPNVFDADRAYDEALAREVAVAGQVTICHRHLPALRGKVEANLRLDR